MSMKDRERSSMVEYELPKLDTWVRFPSLAPFYYAIQQGKRRYGFVGIIVLLMFMTGCKTVEAPYAASVTPVNGVYHYVETGETLWSISKLYDVDIKTILNANNIHNTTYVSRGQRLLIPGATRHAVEPKTFSFSDSFVWPLKGAVVSCFGSKIDRTKNKGIDIRALEGSSVRAAKAGKVVFCDEWLKGFGKTVILDHGDNFQTVYAYNSAILVNCGDVVEQNRVIAKVGRGGRAKEPSLHFEIRRNGEPQNPFYYLSQ